MLYGREMLREYGKKGGKKAWRGKKYKARGAAHQVEDFR